MRAILIAMLALWLCSFNAQADDGIDGLTTFTLDNGLKVVVREDHRSPIVVSQIWYKVGSSYEHRGITGVSHALEHMMFKGTETLAPGEFSEIIAAEGGRENAFTSRDYTAYYQQLASDRLEISFKLEADRMHKLAMDPAHFAKEIQVVMEERRLRTDDNPVSGTVERFFAVAHPTSPYRQPIIGWMADLKNMRLEDLSDWYQRWYAPANAVLVVAGDVTPEQVRELAERHYGKVPAREAPRPKPTPERQGPGERRLEVSLPAKVPYLIMGYQVPSLATAENPADAYALDVLSGILSGGASARLPDRLVRGRTLAASASAGYSLVSRLDTLFLLDGNPATGHDLDDVEQALGEEIEALRNAPVSAEELERAKNQILADHLFQLDSVFYQAMQIGMLEAAGISLDVLADYEANIRAVSAEDIQRVARRYFVPEGLTVARLTPAGEEKNP